MAGSEVIGSLPPRIAREEYCSRQERARAAAADRSLAGLLAWGRGGQDPLHYADLFYLANYYSNMVVSPTPEPKEQAPGWSARGHGALILPVEGPSALIVDTPAFRDDLAVADEIIFSEDVVGATAAAIKRLMPRGQVGIMGTDSLCWSWHESLLHSAGPRLLHADEIGWQLRIIKSDAELALLRAASALGTRAVDALLDAAQPGVGEAEAVAAGVAVVVAGGGIVNGMGIASGPSAHMYSQSQPIPYDSRYTLRKGDMVWVDLYGSIDGYWFDISRGRVVGQDPDDDQAALLDAARDPVLAGVGAIAPGVTFADVAHRCQEAFDSSVALARGLIKPPDFFWGHSLGLAPEPPFLDPRESREIQPGMCISVENHVYSRGIGGTAYEDCVIVTEDGCEVTTPAR